jgi:hypothetical protein
MMDTSDQVSNESETVNLTRDVDRLKEIMSDERFLLVNTINWEDNIIIDVNVANNGQSSSALPGSNAGASGAASATSGLAAGASNVAFDETINERVKYAGWIPSGDHRTVVSFQSKVLGKKVDFLNHLGALKDQSVPTSSKQSSNANANHHSNSILTSQWSSIFPNDNYVLLSNEWEKKIIINPEVNTYSSSKCKAAGMEYFLWFTING